MISVRNLSKTYVLRNSVVRAVDDISFEIPQGELVAFLGPNGAGKSTTIKILCGILSATSGYAEVLGLKAGDPKANAGLGLVFGTRSQLYMHMTVQQSLELIADIYFVHGKKKRARIVELAEIFEIGRLLKSRARSLSLGERMRCELVAALIHKPKILLADEPTIGLDIVAKNTLRSLIKRWQAEERTTLVLTSHDLSDVEALCERCVLIDHGKIQYDGRLSDLRGSLAHIRRILVTLNNADLGLLPVHESFTGKREDNLFSHQYEFDVRKIPMAQAFEKISRHYGENLQDLRIQDVGLEEVLHERFLRNK